MCVCAGMCVCVLVCVCVCAGVCVHVCVCACVCAGVLHVCVLVWNKEAVAHHLGTTTSPEPSSGYNYLPRSNATLKQ